jgi:hypothetical protein
MRLGLNSGLPACKTGTLPLEPHFQSIFAVYFRGGMSQTIFLGLPQTVIPLISALQVARITDVVHWHQAHSTNSVPKICLCVNLKAVVAYNYV